VKLILLNHRRKRNLRSSAHGLTAPLRLHRTVPPSKAARPPFGPLWIHEIKHDGYRLMVRRDGPRTAQFSFAAIDSIRDTS
jgi:ATP-dependent DNA ligase